MPRTDFVRPGKYLDARRGRYTPRKPGQVPVIPLERPGGGGRLPPNRYGVPGDDMPWPEHLPYPDEWFDSDAWEKSLRDAARAQRNYDRIKRFKSAMERDFYLWYFAGAYGMALWATWQMLHGEAPGAGDNLPPGAQKFCDGPGGGKGTFGVVERICGLEIGNSNATFPGTGEWGFNTGAAAWWWNEWNLNGVFDPDEGPTTQWRYTITTRIRVAEDLGYPRGGDGPAPYVRGGGHPAPRDDRFSMPDLGPHPFPPNVRVPRLVPPPFRHLPRIKELPKPFEPPPTVDPTPPTKPNLPPRHIPPVTLDPISPPRPGPDPTPRPPWRVPPRYRLQPPAPGEREVKLQFGGGVWGAVKVAYGATEFVDLINALWEALEKVDPELAELIRRLYGDEKRWFRPGFWASRGGRTFWVEGRWVTGRVLTPQAKLWGMFRYWRRLDRRFWNWATWKWLNEHFQDRAIGNIRRLKPRFPDVIVGPNL